MITLQESLRGVFYAPFYAALARNAFAQEGVDIRFVSSPTPAQAMEGLMAGTVDVGWGGPMRVNEAYKLIPGADLKCFAEVVTKDPFFLISRQDLGPFNSSSLLNRRIATVSEVPTPWLCLQHDLRLAGIDPDALDRISGNTMAENVAALRRNEIDIVQIFQPFAEELIEDGYHLAYAAADRGLCSYTVFYARQGVIAAKREELAGMVRAMDRTLKWVAKASPADIAAAMASYFPTTPGKRLEAACKRYQALGIWGHAPMLPRAGYDRLLASMVSGGFVSPGTPFEQAVDNSLAEAAVASA
jgi:NitT/TauT family transport system substrate-binding protein